MSQNQLDFVPEALLSKYDPDSKLDNYFDLLESENQKINLVSRETSRPDLRRLAAESLLPFETFTRRDFQNYLDIGSGGGLPSIPVIMYITPKNSTLVERTKKKAAALGRMSSSLGLNTKVIDINFEECEFSHRFDLVTLRLVKLDRPLLKKISNFLAPNGTFIYYSSYPDDSSIPNLDKSGYIYSISQNTPVKTFTTFFKVS